ncbi:MAG: TatD family hydrolase [Gemmatimonadetes bacterium]|nr:TatD family hydrolase [Gemmatimonadota bacterium]
MRFIDSHVHLADPAFDADRSDVIARARDAGATALVCIGESLERAHSSRAIAAESGGYIAWTAGVHPHDAAAFDPARDVPALADLLATGAVAVGECGLDSHYDHAPSHLQRRAFAAQLELAREHAKAVVVHTREAADDTGAMIREAGSAGVRGVLHCFTGPIQLAVTALEAGWYISFSGIATFKKWDGDDIVRLVPNDRILVESDAPYLAPVPNRSKRNEPAWVARTVERLATVRGVTPEALGKLAVANAIRLFNLPPAVTGDAD